jgi:hydroxymethylbilane synthase
MKDVPVTLAKGIKQSAVLKRGSYKDILVLHPELTHHQEAFIINMVRSIHANNTTKSEYRSLPLHEHPDKPGMPEDIVIATSSIRRKAQWLNNFPRHKIENLRGNVNTRLQKLKESNWHGAIFAAAGLERLKLRPKNSIELNWMLPSPAQGAIMVVCRENDEITFELCHTMNDDKTALCTKIERDFLSALMGGCSTPISALARVRGGNASFHGNIVSPDGSKIASVACRDSIKNASDLGFRAAKIILEQDGQMLVDLIKSAKK